MSERPKNIAVVTPVFPPYRGGIGTVAELDARQLAALGLEVHVYVPAESGAAPRAYERDGFTVHELRPWLRYGKAALVPQVAGLLRRYDAVLLHHPFFGGTEPLVAARLLSGKGRLLMTYHMDVVGKGVVAAMAAPTRACMPLAVRAAERVLVTSHDYAAHGDLARQHAAHREKFVEMPIATDIGRFAPRPVSERAALRARYGLTPDDRVVVMVGGLDKAHYFKGVPELLAAMALPPLAGARALIVGDGDLRAGFEAEATRLGLAGRVVFAGAARPEELTAHYRAGDVFAFPSVDKSEAFGIVALEAAACGLPVVASNLAGVRTVVRDDESGLLVPPRDPASLAAALGRLLADEPLRARMGTAARAVVEREYAEPARLARWRSLLAELRLL